MHFFSAEWSNVIRLKNISRIFEIFTTDLPDDFNLSALNKLSCYQHNPIPQYGKSVCHIFGIKCEIYKNRKW